MIITVNPDELSAASETLRACAVEAADIGSQLWSCVGCAMPPDIRGTVDQIVATVDRLLDNAGSHFNLWATDLAGRAQIALTDSLTAGSMAGGPATALTAGAGAAIGMGVIGGNSFGDFTITSSAGVNSVLSGAGVIGGNSFGDFTITNSAGLDSVLAGAGIIGGHAPTRITFIDPTTGLEAAPLPGLGVIGGGSYDNPYMTLANAAENMRQRQAARLDALGGGGPVTGAMVMDLIGATGSTPFINGIDDHDIKPIGAMSFTEWANSKTIDTNRDGVPNGFQTEFRRNEYPRDDDR
jgi:hypothetical protein